MCGRGSSRADDDEDGGLIKFKTVCWKGTACRLVGDATIPDDGLNSSVLSVLEMLGIDAWLTCRFTLNGT